MKTLSKIAASLILMVMSLFVQAQQAPLYTHYMYNTLSVNPAYAGSRDAFTVTGLHRSQWVDFKGAPVTQTLTMHTPLKNENIGVGLAFTNDKIGPTNNTTIFGDFAYRIRLNAMSKLALGVSAGVSVFQADLNSLELDNPNDPVYQDNISNRTTPNFGFGAYYSRERFYVGLSAPNLMQNNYSVVNRTDDEALVAKEKRHYFLIAGAVFILSEHLAFKPTTMIKVTSAAPIQADLTATFIIVQKLHLGAMCRTGDAVGVLAGFDITRQLHLGYSFDWSYGLETSRYNYGSHELMLRYDFLRFNDKQIHSPRYF